MGFFTEIGIQKGTFHGINYNTRPEPSLVYCVQRNLESYLKVLTTIFFLVVAHASFGQEKRLLFQYSRHKEVIYNIGDVISFQRKGSKQKITWQISNITDSTIVSGDRSIAPHKIGALYLDAKTKMLRPLRNQYKYYLTAAGIGYFFIDWANSKEIDSSTIIVSGTLIGAGILSAILVKDYIKLKPGRRMVILR